MPPSDLPVSEDGLSVVVPCSGQSLSVSVVDPAIFRLAFDLPTSGRPSYAVLPQPPSAEKPVIGGTAESAVVCTGQIRLEVRTADCHVRATDASGAVILESPEGSGGVSAEGDQKTIRWSAAPGERFYGFGEKTGPLDKRGRQMVFYDTDAYDPAFGGYPPDADPLYASIPFFVGLLLHVGPGHLPGPAGTDRRPRAEGIPHRGDRRPGHQGRPGVGRVYKWL